jgi:hypothetical protein
MGLSRRKPTTRQVANTASLIILSNLMSMVKVWSDSTGSYWTQPIKYLIQITISTQLSMVVIPGCGVCSAPSKSGSSPETLWPATPLLRRPNKSWQIRFHPMIKQADSSLLNRVVTALTKNLKLLKLI